MAPISTVGALLVEDGRILLVKSWKWSNHFTLPGGKVEEGESLVDAVKREMREELGVEVEVKALVNVDEYLGEGNYYRRVHLIFHNFLARILHGRIVPNEEVDEWAWFPLQEAEESPKVDLYTRRAVRAYREGRCWIPADMFSPSSGDAGQDFHSAF